MRGSILAVLLLSAASAAAQAADWDPGPLRGMGYEPTVDPVASWEGPYAGGFGGYAQSHFNSRGDGRDLVANMLRLSTIESEYSVSSWLNPKQKNDRATAFGGFVGYNWQFDEAVVGVEADYTEAHLKGSGSDSIARLISTSDGYLNSVGVAGTNTTEIKRYGTIRARAGYTLGSLMPFVTGGLALADVASSSNVIVQASGYNGNGQFYGYTRFNPANPTSYACTATTSCLASPQTASKSKSTVALGYTAGAGVDWMLTQNIFLRGEYQYAFFNDFDGHKFNLNTVRGGAGLKF